MPGFVYAATDEGETRMDLTGFLTNTLFNTLLIVLGLLFLGNR